MKILRPFLMLFMALLFTACASVTPDVTTTASTLAQARVVDSLMQSGAVDDVVMTVDLSDAELDIYIAALDTYNNFREQWRQPTADMYPLLDAQYTQLYNAYKSVEAIINVHWHEYPPHSQTQLRAYQRYGITINTGVSKALATKNQQQALNNALELGILIAKIAAV